MFEIYFGCWFEPFQFIHRLYSFFLHLLLLLKFLFKPALVNDVTDFVVPDLPALLVMLDLESKQVQLNLVAGLIIFLVKSLRKVYHLVISLVKELNAAVSLFDDSQSLLCVLSMLSSFFVNHYYIPFVIIERNITVIVLYYFISIFFIQSFISLFIYLHFIPVFIEPFYFTVLPNYDFIAFFIISQYHIIWTDNDSIPFFIVAVNISPLVLLYSIA